MTNELIILTQLGTEAAQTVVAHYAKWYQVSAICWLTFGLVLGVLPVAWGLKRRSKLEDFEMAIMALLAAVSILFITFNVPTLLHPDAYSIHRLIKDIRGCNRR